MKSKTFFTSRPFQAANPFNFVCAAIIAGFFTLFVPYAVFAQSAEQTGNPQNEDQSKAPSAGLQIYTDENGNRVMRTTPAPKESNGQNGNVFYIAPQIYPEVWGKGHNSGEWPQQPSP